MIPQSMLLSRILLCHILVALYHNFICFKHLNLLDPCCLNFLRLPTIWVHPFQYSDLSYVFARSLNNLTSCVVPRFDNVSAKHFVLLPQVVVWGLPSVSAGHRLSLEPSRLALAYLVKFITYLLSAPSLYFSSSW